MSETSSKSKKSSVIVVSVFVILLIIAVGAAGYFYMQYQNAQKMLKAPNFAAQQEVQDTVTKVGKLIQLPNDETPTLATVTDVTKLSDQPFFRNAKNGDKVLLYTQSKKAILFRPSLNKIIDVGPISISAPTPSVAPKVSVVLNPPAGGLPTLIPTHPAVTSAPITTPNP